MKRYEKLQIQLTPEQLKQLKEYANENDMSMAAVIRQAVKEYLIRKKTRMEE